ncbi:SusD/RagB family nutrient-binding outer membrane lipoprotein [Saccharicrinis sp. 156]|uniref:SusD/RagB family nutrient-binding outer membrane lipoprotein n=1 Tax=Saccharicrinis sp. 156 TaxID=3417574 RepID=UPI003D353FBB
MNKIKYIIVILVAVVTFSCDVEYYSDPNEPEIAPTYGLMNRVQKRLMDDTRDEWFSGRMSLLWVQYWNQTAYTEEDRFQYRETTNQSGWDDLYKNAQDLIDIIGFNTDEATKGSMEAYGPNENQIAAARIMLVYIYQIATEMWGDVPYYSYGSDDASFQANAIKSDGITTPAYAKQSDIYADMLNELDEAQAMIIETENMIDGDNFFGGDATMWKKFANSLRLRIANRVKDVYPAASSHITDAITAGVMESNDDNVGVTYESNALNGAPMYRAFYVDNRTDFAPSWSFVELLQGKRGPFVEDPRLDVFVADNADGFKVGIPLTANNGEVAAFENESLPGEAILAADYTEIYMEYAEVCFILSETNSWDQTWYEKGVRASMERWGIDAATIDAYIAALPAATEETVITQKYIALYMQPMEAWSEYRRTGYPNTLIKPNETYDYTYSVKDADGNVSEVTETYTYAVGSLSSDVPSRVSYLLNEYSVNEANVEAAKTSMGGDEITTQLWWQP